MRGRALWLIVLMLLASCNRNSHPAGASPSVAIEPPDVGSVSTYNQCKADPRRGLSVREKCQIEKLSARCTAADDCLVSCIASPQGHQVGGGCSHVCSGQHRGESKPPGWNECDALTQDR